MKENILLLCMSPVTKVKSEFKYSYIYKDKEYFLQGIMTNEAPAKSVIERLQFDNGKTLDKIVMICSDLTRKKKLKEIFDGHTEDMQLYKIRTALSEEEITELTTLTFFKEMIQKYSAEVDQKYRDNPIKFQIVCISDFTEANQVAKAAVEAANKVMEDSEDVELYIDYNGGQRYVAFMILAISNLMKLRNIEIKEIMTMNLDNRIDNITPIQNMKAVFGCIDLVAGINEYINYGRAKTLLSFFSNCRNSSITAILASMKEFAHNLQLCRTDKVFEERDKLKIKLQDYISYTNSVEIEDTYEILFSYVVQDILEGYRILLEGDLPEVIQWCVEKEYIQQALTFYAERIPVYFWEQEIFCPNHREEEIYHVFWTACQNNDKKYNLINKIESYYKSYNKKYSWMNKFLDCSTSGYKKSIFWKEYFPQINFDDYFRHIKSVNVSVYPLSHIANSVQLNKAKKATGKLLGYIDAGRAKSKCRKELDAIMMDYQLLKEQRNLTNHAGRNDNTKYWSYQDTCTMLSQAAERLIAVTNDEGRNY